MARCFTRQQRRGRAGIIFAPCAATMGRSLNATPDDDHGRTQGAVVETNNSHARKTVNGVEFRRSRNARLHVSSCACLHQPSPCALLIAAAVCAEAAARARARRWDPPDSTEIRSGPPQTVRTAREVRLNCQNASAPRAQGTHGPRTRAVAYRAHEQAAPPGISAAHQEDWLSSSTPRSSGAGATRATTARTTSSLSCRGAPKCARQLPAQLRGEAWPVASR